MSLLLTVAVALFLVVPDQGRHPLPQKQYASPVPASALPVPPSSAPPQPGFMSALLDSPHPFVPAIGDNPERICDKLDEAGFANSGWRGAEIANVWECMALFDDLETGQASAPANTIFYLLRGRANNRVNYSRMKINLLDPAGEPETLAEAARFMEVLSAAAGFGLPPDLQAAILARMPISIVTQDVSFKLKPEFNDAARFNLSIEFGPALYAFHRTPDSESARVNDVASTLFKGKRERLRKAD